MYPSVININQSSGSNSNSNGNKDRRDRWAGSPRLFSCSWALAQEKQPTVTLPSSPSMVRTRPTKASFPDNQRVISFHESVCVQENIDRPWPSLCDISQTLFFSPSHTSNHHRDTRTFCGRGPDLVVRPVLEQLSEAPHENRKFSDPSTLLLISVQFLEIPAKGFVGCPRLMPL